MGVQLLDDGAQLQGNLVVLFQEILKQPPVTGGRMDGERKKGLPTTDY
jgi:hypothetical protein